MLKKQIPTIYNVKYSISVLAFIKKLIPIRDFIAKISFEKKTFFFFKLKF